MTVRVFKIGGSVLTGRTAYSHAAAFIADHLCVCPGERIVVVVSAETGVTDALLAEARDIDNEPDHETLDLLWSTGELRSAALLALSLQARGVNARALNVHQTGLHQPDAEGHLRLSALKVRVLLARHDVLVAPGFFARSTHDRVVSLGRGGSDLSAVTLASGLNATDCRLVKDVPGYFTADPHRHPDATHLETLTYAQALEIADTGCELVQRRAIEAAERSRIPVVVTAIDAERHTLITD
jgi:aspartate kinase